MATDKDRGLQNLFEERRTLFSVIAVACGLGFAISNASSVLSNGGMQSEYILVISFVVAAISVYIIYQQILVHLRFEEKIEAVLFLDEASDPITVPSYRFMSEFCRTLSAIKAENKAIYADWQDSPIIRKRPSLSDGDKTKSGMEEDFKTNNKSKSARLTEEIANYIIINDISTHLTDYYNLSKLEHEIKTYSREEMPNFLLNNRVINLLSSPIDEREIFLSKDGSKKRSPPKGKIVSAFGPGGAVFNKFELTLPKGAIVKSIGHNEIQIKTSRVELSVSVELTIFSTNIPKKFAEYYIGKEWLDVNCRKVDIIIKGKIRHIYVFFPKGWALYGWLDSLREKMRREMQFGDFLRSINWETIDPVLHCLSNFNSSHSASKSN